jgi:hypothetical protein
MAELQDKAGRGRGRQAGDWAARIALWLATLLLVLYFLGVAVVGPGVVVYAVEDEFLGAAEVGTLSVDPLSTAVTVTDLMLTDVEKNPVVQVGGVLAVAESVADQQFTDLAVRGGRIRLALDENGTLNLLALKRPKEKKEPSEPKGFRVDRLSVGDFAVTLETPFADLEAGPFQVTGWVKQEPGKLADGNVDGEVARIVLSPRGDDAGRILEALTGRPGPMELGPVLLTASVNGDRIDVADLQADVAQSKFTAWGWADLSTGAGKVLLTVLDQGQPNLSLLVDNSEADPTVAFRLDRFSFPGVEAYGVAVPELEGSGMSLALLPQHLSVLVNRFHAGPVDLGNAAVKGTSLSSELEYEGRDKLREILAKVGGAANPLEGAALVLGGWARGNLAVSLLLDDVTLKGGRQLARPLRFKTSGGPDKKGRIELLGELTLHPHGGLTFSTSWLKPDRKGASGFMLEVTVESLQTASLLAAADVPAMVRRMFSGKLAGKLRLHGTWPGKPEVVVDECRFELVTEQGTVVLKTPGTGEVWELEKAPEFSFLTRQVSFGKGKLQIVMEPRKK